MTGHPALDEPRDPPAAHPVSHTAPDVAQTRERLRRIEAVTDVALSKLTMEELLEELLARLRELLETDTATVLLVDESGQFLTPVAAQGLEEEVRQGVRIPMGSGFAGLIAATAAPAKIADVSMSNVVNPILIRKHVSSMLGVPLLDRHAVIGVLHVGTLHRREFSDDDTTVLQLAADRVASAISTRRAYVDAAAAASLQRSLAPRQLPALPGYQFAARYVPSSEHGVSGDWYDVFALPDRSIGVVIGDVMGHGLRAATIMGRIKSALRAYALEHDDPATVLRHLDRKLQHFEPGQTSTLIYAMLDPENGTIRFSSAGHLPLAVVGAGQVTWRVQRVGLPLGVDLTVPRITEGLTLESAQLICLFTDGLVEQRTGGIDAGLAVAEDALAGASEGANPAEAACAALMTALVGDRQVEDDVTILALARGE